MRRSVSECHQTLAQLNSTEDITTLQDSLLNDAMYSEAAEESGQDLHLTDISSDPDSFLDDVISDQLLLDTLRGHQVLLADVDIDNVLVQGQDLTTHNVHSVSRKLSLQETASHVFQKTTCNANVKHTSNLHSKSELHQSYSRGAFNRVKRRDSSSSGDSGSSYLKRTTSSPEVSRSSRFNNDVIGVSKSFKQNHDMNRPSANKNNCDVYDKLLFLEDHRYSSRQRSENKVSPNADDSTESYISSRNSSVIKNKLPVSALETFLRARHSFNPNRGSDALLISSTSNVQTTPTKAKGKFSSGSEVSLSTDIHRQLECDCSDVCNTSIHNPSSETESDASAENKSSLRLLHRLLTDPTNKKSSTNFFLPFYPVEDNDSESVQSAAIASVSPPSEQIQDSDDEQWSKIDYSLMFDNNVYEDDDELDLLSRITAANKELCLEKNDEIEKDITKVGHQRETNQLSDLNNGIDKANDKPQINPSTLSTAPCTLPTASCTTLTAPCTTTSTRKLFTSVEDHETWFLQYFDNLF